MVVGAAHTESTAVPATYGIVPAALENNPVAGLHTAGVAGTPTVCNLFQYPVIQ